MLIINHLHLFQSLFDTYKSYRDIFRSSAHYFTNLLIR